MTRRPYSWKDGPDEIQQHSIAKHEVLRAYLARYFATLVSSPHQDLLRLTLVDGFAGGGLYTHSDTRQPVLGSPFICLDAAREAEALINLERRKPVKLDVSYFFIEKDKHAYRHLDKVLRERLFGDRIGVDIHLRHSPFQDQAQDIINFIKERSPRNGRSIFILDQYGYSDVPRSLIHNIFAKLPRAEVILTFAVDSFLNYASDGTLTAQLLDDIGIPEVLRGRSIDEIKNSESDWRLFIQSSLYHGLVTGCGARYFTPFFIRNKRGHGDYWLLHLSQHARARDVMTEVHWANQNYFIHYGGAGLNMFQMVGYDPDHDATFKGQHGLGFEFDDVARERSLQALKEQIPTGIYANDEGLTFGELFAATCNGSPASAEIYKEAVQKLIQEKIIQVVSEDGAVRRSAQRIRSSDRLITPDQRSLFFP